MSVIELMTEVSARGAAIYLRDGERLFVKPVAAIDDDLAAALKRHRPEILAELRRDGAVADAWERLRDLYLRAGQPDGWITEAVQRAEGAVDELWKLARLNDCDDERFHYAVRQWEAVVRAAIIEAAK